MAQPLVVPDRAHEIAARIVAAVHPWRIVLFGSRARGNAREHSDYDLYVEIDDTRASIDEIDARLRRLAYPPGPSIDVKVKRRGEIERRRDDPGTIEWDVAREGARAVRGFVRVHDAPFTGACIRVVVRRPRVGSRMARDGPTRHATVPASTKTTGRRSVACHSKRARST